MANRNQGQNQGATPRSGTSNRGFASMDAAQQREIARMGGEAVSGNREHMAQIGRKGGEASAESRASTRTQRLNANVNASTDTARSGGAPRDPIARGYADDGGQARAHNERSRGGESSVGNRGLHARARIGDEGGRSLGASTAPARDDGSRMLGVSNMDKAVARSLGGRGVDADSRTLGGGSRSDEPGGNRSLSGRSRDGDREDNGGSTGNRGNAVGSPRSSRDDD